MSKFKTEKICYEVADDKGGYQIKNFIKEFKINSETGEISVKLPPEVALATGIEQVEAKTLDAVEKGYENAMKDYKSAKIKETKVIVYHFEYLSKDKIAQYHGYNSDFLMFKMYAAVFTEKAATSKSGIKRFYYDKVESSLKYIPDLNNGFGHNTEREKHLVLWSQENENFFFMLQSGLEKLVEKADELVDPEKLLETIAKGGHLLGPAEPADPAQIREPSKN